MIKDAILTGIQYKGIEQMKKEVKQLADNLLCSESYIRSIIKKVETNKITIKKEKQ
jgi:hypothetical protein